MFPDGLFATSFDLISPLPRDECVRRLRQRTVAPWKEIFSAEPVVGYVGDASLKIRKPRWYQNTMCWLSAQLADDAAGTRLHCRFGYHPLAVVFWVLWFGGVLLAGGAALIKAGPALLGGTSVADGVWAGIRIPAIMLAGGVIILLVTRFLALRERRSLVSFLHRTIETREVAGLTR
jgi:hypothetical protein